MYSGSQSWCHPLIALLSIEDTNNFKAYFYAAWNKNPQLCTVYAYNIGIVLHMASPTSSCSIPQGSILGPDLFILYINDMSNVSKAMKAILFADDTNLLCAGKDPTGVCDKVTSELIKLNKWFQVNKLSLNVSKTNFMIFLNKTYDDNYTHG